MNPIKHDAPSGMGRRAGKAHRVSGYAWDLQIHCTPIDDAGKDTRINITVRAYPSLIAEAMRTGHTASIRLFLLAKALDTNGRGMVTVDALRSCYASGAARIYGWKRLRQILAKGAGIFWTRDDAGRVWLYSPARIAAAMGIERLAGHPVALPVDSLTHKGQHIAAASFLAAWHAGRGNDAPISRDTIHAITGRASSTQRTYDRATNTQRRRNISILCDDRDRMQVERHAWERGRSTFRLVDYLGKAGTRGKAYLAANLPASYATTLDTLPRGRQRKNNTALRSLVLMGQGNGCNTNVLRVYHDDGAKAGAAYNRDAGQHSHYWPLGKTLKETAYTPPRLEGVTLWAAIHSL